MTGSNWVALNSKCERKLVCVELRGTVSFALVGGIGLDKRCREETDSCGR
jgi:hypothetical protein